MVAPKKDKERDANEPIEAPATPQELDEDLEGVEELLGRYKKRQEQKKQKKKRALVEVAAAKD